jgi:hypothetical protein
MELFRYTESYSADVDNSDDYQLLLSSNLILDFTKDLNIREVQFVDVFEDYKKIVKSLSKFNCLECPSFAEHVKFNKTKLILTPFFDYIFYLSLR